MNMPNNLNEMIIRSGLTRKQVAEEFGNTPETVSRHSHGKIQLTLVDAERYASIVQQSLG